MLEQTGLIVVIVFVSLVAILSIGAGVWLFDLPGRREEEAQWLQAKILDRLRAHSALRAFRILPVAHVPPSNTGPVTLEITGAVPSTAAHDEVLDLVRDTVGRLRREIEIEDHLAVEASEAARAA